MRTLLIAVFSVFQLFTAVGQQLGDVVILGDSNTWIGGDACDKPEGWNKWFKEALQPKSCRSYARSGATWTNTPETRRNTRENIGVLGNDNVVYNQICRLQEAVDSGVQATPQLILILAGTNDAWFRKARPQVFAMSAEETFAKHCCCCAKRPVSEIVTLAASVRYGCELLQAQYPQAQIILLTPFESVQAGAEPIAKAGDIIAACGQKMGLHVIRLDQQSGIRAKQEQARKHLTTDGTHTSVAGARKVGKYVAQQVAALLQP